MSLRFTVKEYEEWLARKIMAAKTPNLPCEAITPPRQGKGKGGPNKTELAAKYRLEMEYPGYDIRYEAITFHLEAKAAYTPDWLITSPLHDRMICVEVKNGAYKHASYGRSKLAFAQAAIEFHQFQFIWMELKNGEWIC
jgi:hypothetical protein